MELRRASREFLLRRYNHLNRTWVNLPAKIQIQVTAEMSAIKSELTARKHHAHIIR